MKWNEGEQFEEAPPGSHVAICYAVVDLGTQQHTFQNETWSQRDVRLSFELPQELMTGKYKPEVKGRPFAVHINSVKQSLHPKAKLCKLLEGWRGKKFDKESVAAFDPRKLVGLPCRLTLVQNDKGYIDITSISPLGKGDKVPVGKDKKVKMHNEPIYVSLNEDQFKQETYLKLSDRLREKIEKSPEFAALMNGGAEPQADAPEGDKEGATAEEDDNAPF